MAPRIRRVGKATVVDLSGRITFGVSVAELHDLVRELADEGNIRLVLNFKDVTYIDSSGIGELVSAHNYLHGRGGQLKLVYLSTNIRDTFLVSKLSTIFDMADSEEAAIASFGSGS